MRLLLALALLVARSATGATFLPCDPVLIAGPEGRPIPNATVSVSNIDGSPIDGGVWSNATGTVPFNNLLPPSQILQVFVAPGIYRVDIAGAGISKTYQIRCTDGVSSTLNLISIDRTPDLLLTNTSSPPALFCPTNQHCNLVFSKGDIAMFDFVMPSFALVLDSVLLTWQTPEADQMAQWGLASCAYGIGQIMCNPTTAPNKIVVASSSSNGFDARRDVLVQGTEWDTSAWVPNAHVVVAVSFENRLDNTLNQPGQLQNIRLEFTRQ